MKTMTQIKAFINILPFINIIIFAMLLEAIVISNVFHFTYYEATILYILEMGVVLFIKIISSA